MRNIALLMLLPALLQASQLSLFTINDIAEIEQTEEGWGGVAELKTLLNAERERATNALTFCAGDFLSPSWLCLQTHGAHMVDLLNRLDVDYVVFGNHEFDFGDTALIDRIAESKFVWLGTNVQGAQGQPLRGSISVAIREVGGLRVGLLGLCTPDTQRLSTPGAGTEFTPPISAAKAAVSVLKTEGFDLIIALTHQLIEEDIALAENVPEIDIILGGHEHFPMSVLYGKTLILKAGHDGFFLGRIDLDIDDGKITPRWSLLPNRWGQSEPEMQAICQAWEADGRDALGEQLAIAPTLLEGHGLSRSRETALGNLIADAIRCHFDADCALVNGGLIHGDRDIPAGSWITLRDLHAVLPFANNAVLIELEGGDLWEALEQGCHHCPQVSGLRLLIDPDALEGERLKGVWVGNQPLDRGRRYMVATSSFIFAGGDGYTALTRGCRLDDGAPMQKVVTDYLRRQESVAPCIEGRIHYRAQP